MGLDRIPAQQLRAYARRMRRRRSLGIIFLGAIVYIAHLHAAISDRLRERAKQRPRYHGVTPSLEESNAALPTRVPALRR
jgi:hypothetical protein